MKTFSVELSETEMRTLTRLAQDEGEAEILSKLVKAQIVLNLATLRKVVEMAQIPGYTEVYPSTEILRLQRMIVETGFSVIAIHGDNQYKFSFETKEVKNACVQLKIFPPAESGRSGYEICCYVL